MSKAILIPEEYAIQLIEVLNEFKRLYQDQIIGNDIHLAPDKYLTEKQAASFLNCSISKLQLFRKNGFIQYVKFGKRITYSEEILNNFIKSNTYGPGNGGIQ